MICGGRERQTTSAGRAAAASSVSQGAHSTVSRGVLWTESSVDPTVKGLGPDQSRSQFFEFTMDARAERQVLGENCRFGDRSRLRATARWKRIVGECTRAAEYLIASIRILSIAF